MPENIISVDGFSSTGKAHLQVNLLKLQFLLFKSGLMYRIISYFALNNGCIIKIKSRNLN